VAPDRAGTVTADVRVTAAPGERRVPFGWSAAAIPVAGTAAPLRLAWPVGGATAAHLGVAGLLGGPTGFDGSPAVDFRLVVACDDREVKRVLVRAGGSVLGSLDIRFADPHQRFSLSLDDDQARLAMDQGVELTLTEGTSPLWIFTAARCPAFHRPGLVARTTRERLAAFWDLLVSVGSIQPFGWMEGCVLDALTELHDMLPNSRRRVRQAIADHLGLYLPGSALVYEDPRGRPADGRFYGIEATLPVAALARAAGAHPAVRLAVDDWRARADEEGCVRQAATTAEGCYTVAYPMAVVARSQRLPELAEMARTQLWIRRLRLFSNDALHLRRLPDDSVVYRHWARAHAWYLLGLVRTARELDGWARTDDLWAEARSSAERVLDLRMPDGLWACFVDDPASGVETCGSAGIAAALALGRAAGRFDAAAGQAARTAWDALIPWLTPDGVLAGSSQANKGGEALQRSGYRVASGVATGLLGQLGAALLRLGLLEAAPVLGWERPAVAP
jgi:hypothetical protein